MRRLRRRASPQWCDLHAHRPARDARDDRCRGRRLPRRLDQGAQRPQPRAQQAHEDDRSADRVDRLRRLVPGLHERSDAPRLHSLRPSGHRAREHRLVAPGGVPHPGHDQRGEPHRRARRPRVRLCAPVVRGIRRHGVLGLPPSRRLRLAARARPVSGCGRDARRLRGVPLVERCTGPHHHGRHWRPRHRGRARVPLAVDEHRAPAAHRGRALRRRRPSL